MIIFHKSRDYSYFLVFIALILLTLVTMNQVNASVEDEYVLETIEVQAGDTLWSIASQYANSAGFSKQEYIEILREINQLEQVMIHPGQTLVVMTSEKKG